MPSFILTGGWPSSAHSVSRLLSQREYKTYCPGIMSTILKRCLEAAAARPLHCKRWSSTSLWIG